MSSFPKDTVPRSYNLQTKLSLVSLFSTAAHPKVRDVTNDSDIPDLLGQALRSISATAAATTRARMARQSCPTAQNDCVRRFGSSQQGRGYVNKCGATCRSVSMSIGTDVPVCQLLSIGSPKKRQSVNTKLQSGVKHEAYSYLSHVILGQMVPILTTVNIFSIHSIPTTHVSVTEPQSFCFLPVCQYETY